MKLTGKKVKKAFLEFRVDKVIQNWAHCRPYLSTLWGALFLIESLENRFETNESLIRGIGGLFLFSYYNLVNYIIKRNVPMARVGTFLLIIFVNIHMTEVAVLNVEYKIYEGFMIMIAVEFYISMYLVVNIWLFPVATLIGHSYCAVRYMQVYGVVPKTLFPSLYVPIAIQVFSCYTFDTHTKRDFLCMYTQSDTIEKFYKLLKSFPERIAITRTKSHTDRQGKWRTKSCRSENMIHQRWCNHPNARGKRWWDSWSSHNYVSHQNNL